MTAKFLPQPSPESQVFWDRALEGELWLPQCVDSGRWFFPPRAFSPFTGGAVAWGRASGRATLASYVIVHRPGPGFEAGTPYVVALAELEEGPRLLTNLPGAPVDPAKLVIGAPLTLVFEKREGIALPQFRLAGHAG
ncbi:MAG: OB-fold domain-containing protein [Sphingobium sp.]